MRLTTTANRNAVAVPRDMRLLDDLPGVVGTKTAQAPASATRAAPRSPPLHPGELAQRLFCDVTGSTALGERTDAETVRELMSPVTSTR